MFYFRIQATPKPDSAHVKDDVGGAYVSVWIDLPDDEEAEALARSYIEDADWVPGLTLETCPTSLDHYSVDDENRKYVEEAIANGGTLVFHQWPSDAEDADVEYDVN